MGDRRSRLARLVLLAIALAVVAVVAPVRAAAASLVDGHLASAPAALRTVLCDEAGCAAVDDAPGVPSRHATWVPVGILTAGCAIVAAVLSTVVAVPVVRFRDGVGRRSHPTRAPPLSFSAP
jgi:hypothetical protein